MKTTVTVTIPWSVVALAAAIAAILTMVAVAA